MRPWIFVFLINFLACSVMCSATDSNFSSRRENAEELYKAGKYKEALDAWYSLESEGYSDPDLFFNIGSAESMSGNIPGAILYFEKAKRFRPADKIIIKAINNERSKIENSVIPVNSFFIATWIRTGLSILRPGGWAMAGLILFSFALFFWLASLHSTSGFFRNIKKGWLLLIPAFIFMLLAFISYSEIHRGNEAIVFTSCDFREAPTDESPLTRLVQPGEKVKINDQLSGWYKVSLLNLDEGWVKKDCLKQIMRG